MNDTPKINLKINQGATFRYKFVYKETNGRAVDLTGYNARMQIRESYSSAIALLELTVANGRLGLGGKLGTITLYISDSITSAINWTKGVYDIELVSPTGDVTRLVGGAVEVSLEVTK